MTKAIPELVHSLSEDCCDVREHRMYHGQLDAPGLSKAEQKGIADDLGRVEKLLVDAQVQLHKVHGLLLNASARWLVREAQGQDPTQEEASH